ncbi:glycine--tRNA ligase [Patescibacteria group bacterium]|nr:glycine--tRNA ligase [Patescibacteria group bacterium]MBU2509523.1 glycine--tRNA ligase [Patescibacteria group bacterium]
MDILVSLCKRRGFIFPGSEIYGGFANSWDYGPYGVELKNNIRNAWWKRFVNGRDDVVGVDTPIIMNPKAWEASGHIETFSDPLVDCKKCKRRFRADHLLEAKSAKPKYDKEKPADLKDIVCPDCGGKLTEPRMFNLMFKTFVGVTDDKASLAYLRPETAGGMFVAWKNVRDVVRKRLPFGVAQVGKAFRNEITPGNFIFRTREFEQMEIEYFVKPDQAEEAFEVWLKEMKAWNKDVLEIKEKNLVYREIPKKDLAHYSARTVDVEYMFPFGQDELYGLANRTDHDLSRHQEASGQDLTWHDPETGEKVLPYVIEPTWGLDRTILAVLAEHLDIDEAPTSKEKDKEPRTVLRFPAHLAPVKAAILPLHKKGELPKIAQKLTQKLRERGIVVEYDESGSIGKRYRRQDEIGTPWCFTVDPESLKDKKVTIRDRDAMTQERIALVDVPEWINEKLS